MFQQGSRASVAFELPAVHPLHTSTSRQPPRSAFTINRTRSTPTPHNQVQIHHAPHRQPSQLSQPPNPRTPPRALGSARQTAGNQQPNALNLPEGLPVLCPARRMAGDVSQRQTVSCARSTQALFLQTNYLQARRISRHVHFDIASEMSTSGSTPSSGRVPDVPPPLRVQPTPLPSVRTVLVESETESDSSLEVRNFFADLITIRL